MRLGGVAFKYSGSCAIGRIIPDEEDVELGKVPPKCVGSKMGALLSPRTSVQCVDSLRMEGALMGEVLV